MSNSSDSRPASAWECGSIATEELVRGFAAAEMPAVDQLVQQTFPIIYSIGYAHLRNREAAEDLAQEVYLRAFTNVGSLKQPQLFVPWLIRIARNLAINRRRNGQRASRLMSMVPLTDESLEVSDRNAMNPRERLSDLQQQQILQDAIGRLPVQLREIVILHYVEGMSKSAIGRALQMHDSSVGRHLSRAHSLLRNELDILLTQNLHPLATQRRQTAAVVTLLTTFPFLTSAAKAAVLNAAAESAGGLNSAVTAGGSSGKLSSILLWGSNTLGKGKLAGAVAAGLLLAGTSVTIYHAGHRIPQNRAAGTIAKPFQAARGDAVTRSSPTSMPMSALDNSPAIDSSPADVFAGDGTTASVQGMVVDENNRAVEGASIRCIAAAGSGEPLETTSSASGSFRIEGLSVGKAVLAADSARHVPVFVPVTLPTKDVRVQLRSAGAGVEGYVFLRDTGVGVSGCEVSLKPMKVIDVPDALQRPRGVITGSDGGFRLAPLAAGTYTFRAHKGKELGLLPRIAPETYELSLRDNETTQDVQLFLYAGHTVRGTVVDRYTSTPIAEATVRDMEAGVGGPAVESNADGGYTLEHVFAEDGSTALAVTKPGYKPSTSGAGNFVTVKLPADNFRVTRDLFLVKAVTISGRVTNESNDPVPGAKVSLMARFDTKFREDYVLSGQDGEYRIDAPPNLNILLYAEAENRPGVWTKTIMVREEPVSGIDLVLRRGAVLKGIILLPGGQPAPGAKVSSYQSSELRYAAADGGSSGLSSNSIPGPETVTDNTGRFSLVLPPEEEVPVAATLPGYGGTLPVRLRLRNDEVREVEWRLEESHSIGGTVCTGSGEPLSGVSVSISSADIIPNYRSTLSDASGRFRFTDLPQTKCGFTLNHPNFGWKNDAGTWPVNREDIDFVFGTGYFQLIGKVVEAGTGRTINNFSVTESGGRPVTITPGTPGTFTIRDIPRESRAGITIRTDSFPPTVRSVASPPPDETVVEQTFEVSAAGGLTGRVVDHIKTPLSNVRILVEKDTGMQIPPPPPLAVTATDTDGRFVIAGLEPGKIVIHARKAKPALTVTKRATIEPAKTADTGDLEFGMGAVVIGRIVRMPGEVPVSAERVQLQLAGIAIKDGLSDAEGRVTFSGLDAATYHLYVPNHRLSVTAMVQPNGTREVLIPLGSAALKGNVTVQGAPIAASVRLSMWGTAAESRTVHTDADGNFTADNLRAGTWSISIDSSKGYLSDKVELAEAQLLTRNFVIPVYRLAGRVLDRQRNAVAGIKVTARGMNSSLGSNYPTGYTESDGSFVIEPMRPGTYGVLATSTRNEGTAFAADVEIPGTGNAPPLILQLGNNTGTISSTVYSMTTGKPIPSAYCRVVGLTDAYGGNHRDANGNAEITDVPPGNYQVIVSAQNYTSVEHAVQVKAGETIELNDVLSEAGGVHWTIKDRTGAPVVGLSVRVEPADPMSIQTPKDGYTSSQGDCYIGGLLPGVYRAVVKQENKPPTVQELSITARETTRHETVVE